MTRLTALVASLCLAAAAVQPAAAQNPFVPRVHVNDRVVTQFEVDQRARFLQLFNTPGDLEAEAIDRLIEEKLQLQAAERFGLRPSDEAVAAGMTEFAGRANLSVEEFVQAIGQAGIHEESFADFVRAGVAWREVVRARFGGRIDVVDADIDRALSTLSQRGVVRVLLSEIILPDTPENAALAQQIAQIGSFGAFEDAARRHSASASREQGGRIDWVPLQNLPEGVRPMLVQMRPGQVTPPIPVDDALILFQLRDVQQQTGFTPDTVAVEYARVLVPGASSGAAGAEIARLTGRADTCTDLAGLTPAEPAERFQLVEATLSQVPADVALELAKLDEGEVSTNLRQADNVVLLMLCSRVAASALEADRDAVGNQVVNQRVNIAAAGYLEELRADAEIRFP